MHRMAHLQDDKIPRPSPVHLDKGDRQDQGADGSEGADNEGEGVVGVGILVLDASTVDILAVQSDDGQAEGELEEAEDGSEDEAEEAAVRRLGTISEGHRT